MMKDAEGAEGATEKKAAPPRDLGQRGPMGHGEGDAGEKDRFRVLIWAVISKG
jgi:hypothetical protein